MLSVTFLEGIILSSLWSSRRPKWNYHSSQNVKVMKIYDLDSAASHSGKERHSHSGRTVVETRVK